jgi:hypothetical protein
VDIVAPSLRRFLAGILALSMAGTVAELLLLGHDEDLNQWIPIVLIAVGLVLLIGTLARPSYGGLLLWRAVMVLFLLAGLTGTVLHYRANIEFQLEVDPSLGGAALFWKAAQAKAPPALAPGVMVQMGLLGLAYTLRHPALERNPV